MRLELTREGLLGLFVNHYTTRDAPESPSIRRRVTSIDI